MIQGGKKLEGGGDLGQDHRVLHRLSVHFLIVQVKLHFSVEYLASNYSLLRKLEKN